MAELNKSTDTNNGAVDNILEQEAKLDLAKVKEYEEQVIESIEAATVEAEADVEIEVSEETIEHADEVVEEIPVDSIDLTKINNTNNQQYQQSYQQQAYQHNMNQQQYANQQYTYQQNQAQQHYYQQQAQQQSTSVNSGLVTPDKLSVEPIVACVLSILLTGLGQMINGQIEKGLLLLFGGMTVVLFISFITCGFGAILSPLLAVISALDAYNCAKRLQNGQTIGKYEFHVFD